MQQCVYERSAIAFRFSRARAGVDHHSGWLIHYRKIGIFVNNVEKDIFRNRPQRRLLHSTENCNPLATVKPQRRLGHSVIHEYFFISNELLHARSAGFRNLIREKLVQAFARVIVGNGEKNGIACQLLVPRFLAYDKKPEARSGSTQRVAGSGIRLPAPLRIHQMTPPAITRQIEIN